MVNTPEKEVPLQIVVSGSNAIQITRVDKGLSQFFVLGLSL